MITASKYGYWLWNLGLTLSLTIGGEINSTGVGFLGSQNVVLAQIVPDQSLGVESSVITPNLEIKGFPSEKIEGGAMRGKNLFHSFKEFSIPEGQAAYFANPVGIEHILSRVTGQNISQIRGRLGVLGNADLFLLNPNGILFGPNSTLDVKGSFIATTANSLIFEDGTQFSATDTSAPPLLTVSIPAGLQFREATGSIINQSQVFLTDNNGQIFGLGLEGQPGKTLALVGGNITLQAGGSISAPQGRIELGSVAGTGQVSLHSIDSGWALSYEGVQNFQDIELSQFPTLVSTTGIELLGGSSIQVQGRNIIVNNGSQFLGVGADIVLSASGTVQVSGTGEGFPSAIAAQAPLSGKAGNITINAQKLIVQDGGRITVSTDGLLGGENFDQLAISTISAGNLIINASESVELKAGKVVVGMAGELDTGLFSSTSSFGAAGNIIINTSKLTVLNGAKISAESNGVDTLEQPLATGAAGTININASKSLELNGGFISTQTSGLGGDAGDLTINTGKLNMINGASILASTTGQGKSGNILVDASQLTLQNGSQISASSLFSRGGDITLQDLDILQVNNSNISASTQSGRAGNVTVNASDSVQLIGTGGLSVEATAGGTAGNLIVKAGQMNVSNRAKVSVSSPQGQAGNLSITANSLTLNRGSITAETGKSGTGSGANITLQLSEFLRLENGSLISATANGNANGGNITINSPIVFAFPSTTSNGSDIIAKAEEGNGGNIQINAQGIFGIAENLATSGNKTNDIDASSQFGASGQVQLKSTIDPNQGVIQLPETVVDPNTLVAQNPCKRGSQSQFTRTGRGGLPLTFKEDLTDEVTQVRLVQPASSDMANETAQKNSSHMAQNARLIRSETEDLQPIVPAQGWMFNQQGQVVLLAYDPNVTGPQRVKENLPGCPVP
jgi:filamentous hemagglutinin family protein